jgi:16S rRNA (uracil1498-N3)-methyltransferase
MRYFYIERSEVEQPAPVITGPDARHIKSVLRLKPGDKIGLFDGKGFDYEARIVKLSPGSVEVSVVGRCPSKAESPVQITVAQAYLKDRKMGALVRQVTELGIYKWIPFISERSVPRPDRKRLSTRTERWRKIAKEALKQCKRGRLTEIGETVSFDEVLHLGLACDLKIAFWESESHPIKSILPPTSENHLAGIFLLIGPEGGFTSLEIERARTFGFVTAALGPRILRAETATLAACTLLQYLFGDMG